MAALLEASTVPENLQENVENVHGKDSNITEREEADEWAMIDQLFNLKLDQAITDMGEPDTEIDTTTAVVMLTVSLPTNVKTLLLILGSIIGSDQMNIEYSVNIANTLNTFVDISVVAKVNDIAQNHDDNDADDEDAKDSDDKPSKDNTKTQREALCDGADELELTNESNGVISKGKTLDTAHCSDMSEECKPELPLSADQEVVEEKSNNRAGDVNGNESNGTMELLKEQVEQNDNMQNEKANSSALVENAVPENDSEKPAETSGQGPESKSEHV